MAEHPRNYVTLFGDRYPGRRYSPVTAMCPDHICPLERSGSFDRMLADASVVYEVERSGDGVVLWPLGG